VRNRDVHDRPCEALSAEYAATQLFAVPVNDTEAGYDYPAPVRFELSEGDASSYHKAAAFLNDGGIDVVCLQHEYGIFGGRAGSHILQLLRNLHMPLVTTLHTVLREPSSDQRMAMEEIAARSDRLIVMSQHSAEILHEVSGVPDDKIDLIPHGVPDLSFVEPYFYKERFEVKGKTVLLTFGLLSAIPGSSDPAPTTSGMATYMMLCFLADTRWRQMGTPSISTTALPIAVSRWRRGVFALF